MGILSLPGEQLVDTAVQFAGKIIDKVWPSPPSPAERAALIGQIAPLLDDRDDAVTNAQKEVIVAEMQQGDLFTRRARPMVVYAGLAFIAMVNVIFPLTAKIIILVALWTGKSAVVAEATATKILELTSISLPADFWWAWGSVVSIWSIGRTAERRGVAGKMLEQVMGTLPGVGKK